MKLKFSKFFTCKTIKLKDIAFLLFFMHILAFQCCVLEAEKETKKVHKSQSFFFHRKKTCLKIDYIFMQIFLNDNQEKRAEWNALQRKMNDM